MARVNVVLFDLDDTLLDYSGEAARCWSEACATVAGPAGVDADALRGAIRDVGAWFWSDPERHRRERTDMLGAWRKIVEGALERCGDVLGAQQVGVRAAWLDRPRQGLPSDALAVPDRILDSLTDLTTLE